MAASVRMAVRVISVSQQVSGFVEGEYLFTSLAPSPILSLTGKDVGSIGDSSLVISGNVCIREVATEGDVIDIGDYYVNYGTGYIAIRSSATQDDIVFTWKTRKTESYDGNTLIDALDLFPTKGLFDGIGVNPPNGNTFPIKINSQSYCDSVSYDTDRCFIMKRTDNGVTSVEQFSFRGHSLPTGSERFRPWRLETYISGWAPWAYTRVGIGAVNRENQQAMMVVMFNRQHGAMCMSWTAFTYTQWLGAPVVATHDTILTTLSLIGIWIRLEWLNGSNYKLQFSIDNRRSWSSFLFIPNPSGSDGCLYDKSHFFGDGVWPDCIGCMLETANGFDTRSRPEIRVYNWEFTLL